MFKKNDVISYHYEFTFNDGTKKEFHVELDPMTLNLIPNGTRSAPDWARLEYDRCDNCPLNISVTEFCPVAIGFSEIIDSFKDIVSYEEVTVSLTTNERNIWKHTTVQNSVSSLIGIYMVTTGCPIMTILKPMARYHLPFASIEETTYRATSMYLLRQYFMKKYGIEPDWEFHGLAEAYENVRIVNMGMSRRLCNASSCDANVNALVHLDVFAMALPFSIQDTLSQLEYLFADSLKFTENL